MSDGSNGSGRPPRTRAPRSPLRAGRGASVSKRQLERAARAQRVQQFLLRLYITGTTPASSRAVERVRQICDDHLRGRYQLEVFDIYRMPALAKDEQIIATPTLIKVLPTPLRRFIGDLSKIESVLFGLDLRRTG